MDEIILTVAGISFAVPNVLLAAAGSALLVLAILTGLLIQASRRRAVEAATAAERERELDEKLAGLTSLNAQMSGRIQTMAEVLGSRQSDLARLVSERLDAVGQRVGQGLESGARNTSDHLSKLNERLAVIDAAQNRLAGLAGEIVGLRDILANKQTRGAFGQGRMESIVRDGLPTGAYEFQYVLSNRTRPDCVIRLPGDERVMVVDAKFPLEAFTAFREAADETARQKAAQRIRTDVGKHVRDIAERYFLPGETQDLAVMFVPSESIYADVNEHFGDVVEKAHRSRIIMVSPSLLMMAIQVMQSVVRDARMREQAHQIQAEVRLLLDDVRRLQERSRRLEAHFRQAQEDMTALAISSDKIARRSERIELMEFPAPATQASAPTRAAE